MSTGFRWNKNPANKIKFRTNNTCIIRLRSIPIKSKQPFPVITGTLLSDGSFQVIHQVTGIFHSHT